METLKKIYETLVAVSKKMLWILLVVSIGLNVYFAVKGKVIMNTNVYSISNADAKASSIVINTLYANGTITENYKICKTKEEVKFFINSLEPMQKLYVNLVSTGIFLEEWVVWFPMFENEGDMSNSYEANKKRILGR